MMYELQQADYFVRYQQYITGEISYLFFTYPKSIELFKWYYDILLLDCTYKTNRFKMPLLNIVGVNGLGDNFHVGFAFLSAEEERDYLWAIQELKTLM